MNFQYGRIPASSAAPSPLSRNWHPSRSKLRFRLAATLVMLDAVSILGGFLLGSTLYAALSGTPVGDNQWLLVCSVLLPIYLLTAFNVHGYAAEVMAAPARGVTRALRSLVVAGGTVLLVAFYLKTSQQFSRGTFGIGFIASLLLLGGCRDAFLRHTRRTVGDNLFNVVLISDTDVPMPIDGFSIIIPGSNFDPDEQSPDMYDRLATALRDADRVVVACAAERRLSWTGALKGANVQSEIITPELGDLAPLGMGSWNGVPTLVVADGPLGRIDSFVKRGFDIAVAGCALFVLLPLFAVVAALIKLESKGPVFFVQPRIGLGNGMFRMLKFRSMRTEALDHAGHTSTARDDDRITRVGRFIRGTSIDELPQLINVLLGDMSIVGPRPHAIGSRAEDKLFWEIDQRYWHRHAAKPGLTGLAQVRGYRGATLREQDLTDRLQADLEYLNDWSVWKDIKIMLMTFKVLVHKNAY